ncbi:tubulin nucleotide-binding domain-like protein [Amniculicola lignicola CBS 123094]|uniref:Tubulin nucleotide-binding domain-like protein n=1 Tax=Amniculicola lignicola CBS 123094 TaxID=1392246 RepID=A0A6A5W461_9PLEO|nr:tubulin nucleotide-binding domain-like protein [Amniculicola lignicola CBS 123094]
MPEDFAAKMKRLIGEQKAKSLPTKPGSFVKRAEIEAARKAEYEADQKVREEKRLKTLEEKRIAEEEAEAKAQWRRELEAQLAIKSKRKREEEEVEEERKRRKRLGLPPLPEKKLREDGTSVAENEDMEDEQLVRKLRALDEPAILFGETHKQRLRRYKKRIAVDSLAAITTDGPIPTTLRLVPEKDMKIELKVPKDKDGKDFLFRQLASYFTMVLREWEIALAQRTEEVKTSYTGKQAYTAMVQARENLRPLFKKLEKGELDDAILEPVVEIVHAAQERRYVDANDGYLRLAIGKAAWPIGVTMESYFTYPPEPESPVNHDILFRPGVAPDGSDTFTPRTLIYDLKNAFGSMRKVNALYEPDDGGFDQRSGVWPSKPIIQKSQPIPQSLYQTNLDAGLSPPTLHTSDIRYWSDYSRLYYHPRSLVQLSEFDVNDTLMSFEKWDVGSDLFQKLEREVDLVDRDLRPFVEECDGMQGLQIFTGVDDAWGGWASGWLEKLRDEYGKMSIWTWGLGDGGGNLDVPRGKRLQQVVNSSRSLEVLAEHSSVYIPMSNKPFRLPSYLTMDSTSLWHVAALQSIAVDTITMPSRLRLSDARQGTLQDMEETFNGTGRRRIAKVGMSIADPEVLEEKYSNEVAQAEKSGSMTSRQTSEEDQLSSFDIDAFTKDFRMATSRAKKEHVFGRVEAYRGEWNLAEESAGRDPRDRFNEGPALQRLTVPLLFPLLDSFPSMFDVGSGQCKNLAVHSGLTTSTAVAAQVRSIEQMVRRMVSLDEREALCNSLHTIAEEYDEGWDSGSDSDEDD